MPDPDLPKAAKRRDGVDGVDTSRTVPLSDTSRPKAPNPLDEAAAAAASAATRTILGRFGDNIVEWTVDAEGRLISAKAHLTEVFKGLERSADEVKAQGEAAAKGIAGDHGGHAVPHRFLGDQGGINMFPQNGVPDEIVKMVDGKPVVIDGVTQMEKLKNFNGSAFKTLENELADWVEAGGKVDYEVKFSDFDPKFPDRPNTVRVEYKVYNDKGVEVYKNRDRFSNSAGQTFERLSKADIADKMNL